jgi:hypothetical protein
MKTKTMPPLTSCDILIQELERRSPEPRSLRKQMRARFEVEFQPLIRF